LGLAFAVAACTPAAAPSQPTRAPAVESAPLSPEQLLQQGDAALARGRYEEATRSFTAALQFDDVQARAEVGLRQVHVETGQYEAAAREMRFGVTAPALLEQTVLLQASANAALGDV